MKTDNAEHVGKHAFELAGLGQAPFRFVSASDNVITYPDGSQKAGGSCDYCGTGIRTECWVKSSDGKQFKVGCNCIEKVGDKGLLKAYRSSRQFRQHQAELRVARDKIVTRELVAAIADKTALMATKPHPYGFTDRQTGQPLTLLDYAHWMFDHCGASGRKSLLTYLRKIA